MISNTTTGSNSTDMKLYDNKDYEIPDWAELVSFVFMSVVTILGLPGNGIILIVQWKNREKSSTDYLITTLAVFECFCSGFNSIMIILRRVKSIWLSIASAWICRVHTFSMYNTSISSTLLLTVIALDRYSLACRPLHRSYSKRKAKMICCGIVVTSITLSSPSLAITSLDAGRLTCVRDQIVAVVSSIIDVSLGIAFLTMFIVVVVCYTKVILLLRKRHRQNTAVRNVQASTSKTLSSSVRPKLQSQKDDRKVSRKNTIYPIATDANVADADFAGPSSMKGLMTSVEKPKDSKEISYIKTIETFENDAIRIHRREGKIVNRTTLIMFIVTMTYIVTWVAHWIMNGVVSSATLTGRTAVYLTKYLHMVNCMTNPIFFIVLSSKFRKNATKFLRRN